MTTSATSNAPASRVHAALAVLLLAATALVWPAAPTAADPTTANVVPPTLAGDEDDLGTLAFEVEIDTVSSSNVVVRAEIEGRGDDPVEPAFDFTRASYVAEIPVGQTSTSVTVEVVDDAIGEVDEDYRVVITATESGDAADPFSFEESFDGTIRDDDQPVLSLGDDTRRREGNDLVFTVNRRPVARYPSTAEVTVVGDTADEDDYGPVPRTVTIPANTNVGEIRIPTSSDLEAEDDETLVVSISNPTNATLGSRTSATGTISDVAAPNTAPTVEVVDNDSLLQVDVGQAVTVVAIVEDPDDDVEAVVFDWGDGSEPTEVDEPAEDGRWQAVHEWTADGLRVVSVTARDDEETSADPGCSTDDLGEVVAEASCRQVLVVPAGDARRAFGPARAATAANLARDVWDAADTVLVAREDAFPDALAAGPLAAQLDAPLLLSRRDRLSQVAADAIDDLGASRAVVLGGEAALSEQVTDDLAELGLDVRRVRGPNRFATAADAALEVGGDEDVALLALGQRADDRDAWPDALSAGAYRGTYPLVLATPDRLPAETLAALRELDVDEVVVLGGAAAIGDGVVASLRSELGVTVTRIAGTDRYATSAAAFDDARERLGGTDRVVVATGRAFPDGLAAGAAAAELDATLVLTDPLVLPAPIEAALLSRSGELETALLVGGTAAIAEELQDAVELAIT